MANSDRTVDLPQDLAERILSLLPIRDAVRTSILSRTWRYKWNSMPDLVFKRGLCSSNDDLVRIVSQCLHLHRGLIRKFSVVGIIENDSEIDMWISLLSRHGIQELKLRSRCRIPSCLFDCKKLMVLKLLGCKLLDIPPAFEGFVNLKSLHLSKMVVDSSFHRLISRCPLLESLSLISLRGPAVRIDAPKIKYLELRSSFEEISLEHLPALVEMDFGLDYWDLPRDPSGLGRINLFSAAPNLKKLKIHDLCLKYFEISYHPDAYLMHLKHMELSPDLVNTGQVLGVLQLLLSAPNLENFVLSEDTSAESSPFQVYSDFQKNYPLERYGFMKLKTITIYLTDIIGLQAKFDFAEFLLSSSPVLDEVLVNFAGNEEESLEAWEKFEHLRTYTEAEISFEFSIT